MIVIPLVSRGSIEIPLSQLLSDGKLDVNAEIEARDYLRFHFRGKKLEVTAGKYVGLIPVNANIVFDVQPKMPVSNLTRVVDAAQLRIETLETAKRPYAATPTVSISTTEFVARSLVDAVRPIVSQGLSRQYSRETRTGQNLRGRLLRSKTVRNRAANPFSGDVVTAVFAPTVDHRTNRVLKLALVFISRRLATSFPQSRTTAALLNDMLRSFEGVRFGCSAADIAATAEDVRGNRLQRQYYAGALRIALFVLRQRGLSLTARAPSAVDLPGYVIDFESMFETYVRNTLRERLRESGTLRVRDGNKNGAKWLFDEARGPKANPDIVIERSAHVAIALVEVKYKDHVDRSDVNQCIAYGFSYRVPTVFLVRQRRPAEPQTQVIGTIGNVQLIEYRLDLAAPDLPREEEDFARFIEDRLPP